MLTTLFLAIKIILAILLVCLMVYSIRIITSEDHQISFRKKRIHATLFVGIGVVSIGLAVGMILFFLAMVRDMRSPDSEVVTDKVTVQLERISESRFIFQVKVPDAEPYTQFNIYSKGIEVCYFFEPDDDTQLDCDQEIPFDPFVTEILQAGEISGESIQTDLYPPIALSNNEIVRVEDVNFDGHPDIGVFANIGNGGENKWYTYYAYYHVDGTEAYSYIPVGALSGIANPVIDSTHHTIISTVHDEEDGDYIEMWEVYDGRFTQVGLPK